ncbi:MAG TPA: c-type cytochrome [Steroidobacteraceae bacterium]|jgi:cytochrome c oxidase cbb3-type subunit 3|nr:c-type cytochrome [Steroidobacteraceae bacterium]
MLRLFLITLAGLTPLAMSGCSASDPPPSDAAAPAAAAEAAGAPAGQLPGTPAQPVSGTVPPVFAPVGPIPGPQVAGEDPATTMQNPYANNPSALEQGRQLFVAMNCAGCHGGHAGGGMGPDLRPDHIFRYGNAPANLFDSISMGRAMGMPAWGTKLPTDVIWKLAAYLQSLGTQQEPDKAAPAPAHAPDSVAAPSY